MFTRALNEAVSEYDSGMSGFYSQAAEAAASQLANDYDNVNRIHSPMQNLALYQQLLASGNSPFPGVNPQTKLDMAAIFLGSASDKNVPITEDTVRAVGTIMGITGLSDDHDPNTGSDDVSILATKAEAIRSGIATGHGE